VTIGSDPAVSTIDLLQVFALASLTLVVAPKKGVVGMAGTRLTKLEIQIMETLWNQGEASIREMQEAFPEKKRPGYTTVQKTIYRMEAKKVVRRIRKVGNFHIFAATVSRDAAQRRLVDDLLAMFGGRSRPVVAHLIGAGKLTLEDVEYAEKTLKELKKGGKV
jgi:BlaI family penicillinase repressor